MHHVTVTTAAGANSNRSAPSTSANMVEGVPAGEPPPHPRIMTSSPGGVLVSGTAMTTQESTTATTAHPTNARAATLSALGSSVGSSGGGMSDSGFAASISSGFGPGSSSTGSTTGGGHVTVGPNKPDLSHLTAEERAIIENVIHRHHTEENKEYEFLR